MESVGANNYFEHFGCEGEEISGGDVGSRKGCSVFFFFFLCFFFIFFIVEAWRKGSGTGLEIQAGKDRGG